MLFNLIPSLKCDIPQIWGLYFQDSATPSHEGIIELHDHIMFYLIFIVIAVSWVLASIIRNFKNNKISFKYANHGTIIELIWTISPALVLIAIAFPSFKLLYLMDEVVDPALTVKICGNQWYWTYTYSDFAKNIQYDSYPLSTEDKFGALRLLEVDEDLIVPVDTHTRFIVTSADVIHDFAVPSLGLKIDAVPGRLNQVSIFPQRTGSFYGQCSELCGVLHAAMPICVKAVPVERFITWIHENIENGE